MAMRDMVRTTDWARWNLPKELSVRIGLHAGPVYCVREPLLDRVNFFGFHVNQAARIEPITSPGNVYASESFASLMLRTGTPASTAAMSASSCSRRSSEATRSTISSAGRK